MEQSEGYLRVQAKEPLLGAYLAADAESGGKKKKKKKKSKGGKNGKIEDGLEEAILEKLRYAEQDQGL